MLYLIPTLSSNIAENYDASCPRGQCHPARVIFSIENAGINVFNLLLWKVAHGSEFVSSKNPLSLSRGKKHTGEIRQMWLVLSLLRGRSRRPTQRTKYFVTVVAL